MIGDVAILQDEVNKLKNEQLAIEERLKDIGERRDSRNRHNKKKRPFFAESNDQERVSKPRVMSAVAAVIQHDTATSTENHDNCSSKPLIREQNLNPDAVRRNRRMFGALMGHLGKAQQSLKTDSSLLERQNAVKSSAMHRHVEESKRIIKQQRKLSLREKNMVSLTLSLYYDMLMPVRS